MTRNPAALAHLWDDQVVLGAHLLLVDACMQPTGAYAWGVKTPDVILLDGKPVFQQAQEGDTDLDGNPLVGYAEDPYPEVCYQGPAPFLPHVALSMKLSDDLGVGLGFFPPDSASLNQWGNRDGTVDTEKGPLPNPLRYFRAHQNVSFFSLLGAVGYRLAPWISIGAGFQWSLAVYSAKTWSTPVSALDPKNDVRSDVFGRDLFIPGLIGSIHLKPLDALDVVLGFKWSGRVESKVKIDITTGAFGTGDTFQYISGATGQMRTLSGTIPTTGNNQPGVVDAPPVWSPQLTFGLRYADLIKPRFRDLKLAHEVADGKVEDHMATERWDIEVDVIYYLASVIDRSQFSTGPDTQIQLLTIDEFGNVSGIPASPGDCSERDPDTQNCIGERTVRVDLNGKDQLTVRVGGDYNILPGLFSVRAGVSYEARSTDPEYLNVLNYMLSRIGIHGGLTVRLFDKTDISFGYAHFIHEDVRLQVNNSNPVSTYPRKYKTEEYHFKAGAGVEGFDGTGAELGGFDGNAGVEVPNADQGQPIGPYYINAGSYFFHLDVVSLAFTQHF